MNNLQDKSDLFSWGGLEFYQDESVHKIGTDAILLGSWIPGILPSAKNVLDIGTGTGILSLMMAKAYPKIHVHAVDVNEKAIALATQNVNNAGFNHRISIAREDVFASTGEPVCDVVISNPPYYNTHNPSASDLKNQNKHTRGPVSDWMNVFIARLTDQGHCFIIVPAGSAEEWILAANHHRFYNTHRMDVYSFASDKRPVRSLLHFSQALKKPIFSDLTLYEKVNTFSAQYLDFSGIARQDLPKNNR